MALYDLPGDPVMDSHIRKCGYKHKGILELPGDAAIHWNRSDDPNCGDATDNPDFTVALKEIKSGDELTLDYRTFDDELELCGKFLK